MTNADITTIGLWFSAIGAGLPFTGVGMSSYFIPAKKDMAIRVEYSVIAIASALGLLIIMAL